MKTSALFASHWVLFMLLFPISATPAGLNAGFATVDITPPVGWRMSGYFYERHSTLIHDPLQAKVLVLQEGGKKAAVVFCDLIGISQELSSRVRSTAARKTGIPADAILISATHTHTGPLYYGVLRDWFHQTAVTQNGVDPFERLDYPEIAADRIVTGIAQALRQLQPVQLEVGHANQTGLSFNRRFLMKDGSVVTNPGKTNANIVRPAGPIDPDLGMLFFLTSKGDRTLATFTSFALHPDTVGGTEYSADYPYYLEKSMQNVLGSNIISFFGNSTCGDINHIDVLNPRVQKGQSEAERIGTNLAATVLASCPELKPVRQPGLSHGTFTFSLPLQQYDTNDIAQAEAHLPKVGTSALPLLEQARICKIAAMKKWGRADLKLQLQAIRLGSDTVLLALPGEVFVELGLAIKKASPFKHTFIIEQSNDCIHYVPTEKAFTEGSYETINSILKPGGGEIIVLAAGNLLRQMK